MNFSAGRTFTAVVLVVLDDQQKMESLHMGLVGVTRASKKTPRCSPRCSWALPCSASRSPTIMALRSRK
jgi:hypothetical protein